MSQNRPILFHHARVHTVDPDSPRADWFTVLGKRIQKVGRGRPPALKLRMDLKGRIVVPGFVDAHAHLYQTGLDKLFMDLAGVRSRKELGRRLAQVPGGPRTWIFAHSFEEDRLEDVQFLTRHHLDELVPERPLWINRVDYHSAVVNTAALRRLDIPSGIKGKLAHEGITNGILRSEAYFFAKSRINRAYPIETREKAFKAATDEMVRNGVTAVHALEGGTVFGDEGVALLLKRMHGMPLDVTLFLQEKNVYFTSRLGFEHLGGCILIDGSIGSYTAAIDGHYKDFPKEKGILYEKPREFFKFVEEAHRKGIQLAFHAIGPRAIELVLRAYDKALSRFPRYDHRHRIEHFEMPTAGQIDRARDLGVVVSMQPTFEHLWGGPEGMYAARLGEGWKKTNPLRTILGRGLRIAGGTDSKVTPPVPLLAIHSAVNHPNPEQRIRPAEALRMMTLDAAYAAFNDHRHGSICPGKEASFAVLDKDLLDVPKSSIKDIRVLETWHKGSRVFRHKA